MIPKSRAALIATLALAGLGLAADRLLLGGGPQSASAQAPDHTLAAPPTARPSAPAPAATPAATATPQPIADLAAIRDRLAALAASPDNQPGNATQLPPAWSAALAAPAPAATTTETPAPPPPLAAIPKLSAILRSPDGSRAKLDGHFLTLNQTLGNLTLIAIDERSVTLRDSLGREYTATLPH
jgi:hypothetical protein